MKTIEILQDHFRFSPEDAAELTELTDALDVAIDRLVGTERKVIKITASMVSELREQSGCGLMECKRVLEECAGDIDAAADVLYRRVRSC